MQFYKTRDFGELIADTVTFFKEYGRNFFRNYLLLNGGLVVLFVVVLVIGYGGIIKQLFEGNLYGGGFLFGNYFSKNQTMLIISSGVALLLILLMSAVSYSFPVLYLKRVSQTKTKTVLISEIVDDLKRNALKFLKFFLGTTLILLPLFLGFLILSGVLILFFLGVLLLIVLLPVTINVVNFTLFHLYNTDDGYFLALRKALRFQFSKDFWKYAGSTLVVYMLIQMVAGVILIVPMVLFYLSVLTNPGAMDIESSDPFSALGIVMFVAYLFSVTITVLLLNVQYVNTGLMYYNSRSDLHRKVTYAEIDTIGAVEK